MIARKEMQRAKVRFGLLVGAIALLVFLILFQQALRDGLITSFIGGIEHQDAPVLVYSTDARRNLQSSTITPELEAQVRVLRRGRPASQATVILDIDAEDGLVIDRITTLVTAAGFAAGIDLHLSTIAGSAAMKVILTGPIGGVLDAAAAVRRVVELAHD